MGKTLRSLVLGLVYPAVLATFILEVPPLLSGDAEVVVKWVLAGLVLRYVVGYLYLVGTLDAQWTNKGYSHRCAVLDLGVVLSLYFAVQMLHVSAPMLEQSVPTLVLNDIWYFLIAAKLFAAIWERIRGSSGPAKGNAWLGGAYLVGWLCSAKGMVPVEALPIALGLDVACCIAMITRLPRHAVGHPQKANA